jgi:lysophospholipase L1-like esterase
MSESETSNVKPRLSRGKVIFFALLPVLILIVVLEGGARLLGAKPFENIENNPYMTTPLEMEWVLKPNIEVQWPNDPEIGVTVKTNSLGLRNDEVGPKGKDEMRILFLGDSVVFGTRLPQDKTIPAQLEKKLREEGENIRVINAGVEGYSTFQEYHQLRHIGLALDPDVIVLGFVVNDVYEQYRTMIKFGGDGNYMGVASNELGRKLGGLLYKSAFLTWLMIKMESSKKSTHSAYAAAGLNYDVTEIFKDPWESHIEEAWDETMQHILKIKQLADESEALLLVLFFPYDMQFDEATPHRMKPNEHLWQLCQSNDILFVDFSTQMEIIDDQSDLYIEGDGTHFNEKGSEFIASQFESIMLGIAYGLAFRENARIHGTN